MQSPDYLRRMERVLARRVEDKKVKESRPTRRLRQALGIVAATLACFFLLKAAGLAHDGTAFAQPVTAEAGFADRLHQWFAGADPISSTLAAALRPSPEAAAPIETL